MNVITSCFLSLFLVTGIYDYSFVKSDGTVINLSSYQGKKILIVNLATESEHAMQIAQLQQLQDQHSDSLIVIGFPSNSFGNEVKSDLEITPFLRSQYGATFPVAIKGDVKGENIQPLFEWLTSSELNGQITTSVSGDFQKYLIDSDGELIGVFRPQVSPLSIEISRAITENYE